MTYLLNWRIWAAVLLCIGQAAFGWKMYKIGGNSVQVTFDTYKNQQVLDTLASEKAARAKEQAKQVANQKVSANYESLKSATATAVLALDTDRMRLQAAIASSGSGDPTSPSSTDGGAKDLILDGCIRRYAEVAGDAKALSNQVTGLQDYVKTVVHK